MIKLLRFEFRKLFRRKSFYICLAVQFGYLILTALLQLLMQKVFGTSDGIFGEDVDFTAGYNGVDYLLSAVNQGATSLILAVFVTLFACEDRTSDVLKNIYARGYDSMRVYFSEFIAICAFCAIYCAASWLFGFLIGTAMFGVGSGFNGLCVFMLFVQILAAVAYSGLFLMFSKVIPRQGGAIAMNIFAPVILSLIFSVIDVIILVATEHSGGTEVLTISKYALTGLFQDISVTTAKAKDIAVSMALSVGYAAVFVTIGAFVNRKKQA